MLLVVVGFLYPIRREVGLRGIRRTSVGLVGSLDFGGAVICDLDF